MASPWISSPFTTQPREPKKADSYLVRLASQLISAHRPSPDSFQGPENDDDAIRVVCLSDTHNKTPTIPDGDILLHAGDLTQYGLFPELQSQLHWLNTHPHPHKVLIAGNHDSLLDLDFVSRHPDRELDKAPGQKFADLNWGSLIYLQDRSTTVSIRGRKIKIFGSPWTPRCGSFAFQYNEDEPNFWQGKRIPPDTDILLTHGPPAAYLDNGKGCRSLLREIFRTRRNLALVVFGHIHEARGSVTVGRGRAEGCFQEVMLDRMRAWNVLCLIAVSLWSSCLALMLPARKERKGRGLTLVNAAVAGSRDRPDGSDPIVVEI